MFPAFELGVVGLDDSQHFVERREGAELPDSRRGVHVSLVQDVVPVQLTACKDNKGVIITGFLLDGSVGIPWLFKD